MAAKAKKSGRLAIYTRQDKAILFIGYVLLALFVVAIVVPVVYIVIASFMDPVTLQNQGITFDFSKWTPDRLRARGHRRPDLDRLQKRRPLLGALYRHLGGGHHAGGLPHVPARFPRQKRSSTPSLSSPCSSAVA